MTFFSGSPVSMRCYALLTALFLGLLAPSTSRAEETTAPQKILTEENADQAPGITAPEPEAKPTTPEYIRAFNRARDLVFNREYDAARKVLTQYGTNHLDDPIEAVGEALLELLALAEVRDFRQTQRLDAVFARARVATHSWIPRSPDPVYATMLAGAADAIDALWQLKTGSTFSGLSLARSAINLVEAAATAPEPSLDARGFYSMYLYMRGRFGDKYIPFLSDTRPEGRLGAEQCVKNAPTMGPLCHIFLLYVAKWEARWDDLDQLADSFRKKYPGSMFAALIQAEGLLIARRGEEALSVLVDVGQYDPHFALHHLWMGRVYWEGLQEPLPAEEFINLALEKGLNQPQRLAEAHTVLAEIAMSQGYLAEAKIRLDWAKKIDSDNGRTKAAEEYLDKLLDAKQK